MFKLPENLRIVTENVSVFYHDNNRYVSCIRKGRSDNNFDINTKKEKITIDSVQEYITDNISQTYKHLDSTILCMFTLNPDSTIKKIELYPYKDISEYIPENFKSYNEINIDSTYITLGNINKKMGIGPLLKLNGLTQNDIYSPILKNAHSSNVENNIALTDSEEINKLKNDLKKLPKHLFSSIIHNTQIYQEGDSIIKPEVIYYTPIVCKDIDKLLSSPLSIEDQLILSMKPTYRGEGRDLNDFIIDRYNNTAWHLAGKTGALKIKFIVHKDGTLSSFETLEATNDDFPKGIVSFIKETEKKWTPGIYKNQYVDCEYIFDISLIERGGYTRQQLNQNDFIVKVNDLDYELDIDAHTAIAIGKNYNKSEITIPATITRNNINYKVTAITGFNNKTRLKKVVIEDGIVSIGIGAFSGCTSLESIIIPNSVTTIESFAFEKCTSLESISLPNNLKTIYAGAFYKCISLKTIEIPNSVEVLSSSINTLIETPNNALSPNVSIFNVNDLNLNKLMNLKGIFEGCKSLERVIFSNSIKVIEQRTFRDCSSLKAITIPENITKIEEYAFKNCSALKNITIPENIEVIGSNAFENCISLDSIMIHDNICIYANAFINTAWYNSQPEGFVYLDNIFLGYKGDKSKVTHIEIKNGTKVLANESQNNGTRMTSTAGGYAIQIKTNIEFDMLGVFEGYTSLKSIIIPNSIKTIGNRAFYGCSSLESIILPDSLKEIHPQAFENCTSLKSIIIPNTIREIGERTFYGCSSLESIIIPNQVNFIHESTFENCTSLKNITIHDNLNFVAANAFANTAWYNSQPEGLVYLNSILLGYKGDKSKVTHIDIKDGTKILANDLFKNCRNLVSVTIPESVTKIGMNVFQNCKQIKKITIPAKVTEIGIFTFDGCTSLETLEFKSTTPPKELNEAFGFRFFEKEFQLIVPIGSEAAYQEAFNSK
ncbi:MAG: leucine-rich repeat domain-containing protein [Paludibacteraceae bacterium]|nr:leucine-rich repeat domain-containing protein [Paludibacteraceae bacterium]